MTNGIILCTTNKKKNAKEIAKNLIEKKLAACVNVIDVASSIYSYEDKIFDESEYLLIIKTRESLFEQVKNNILELHEYTLPEIIFLPITKGYDKYMKWIKDETK